MVVVVGVRVVVVMRGVVVVAALIIMILERCRDLDGVLRDRGVARRLVELLVPPAVHVAENEGNPLPARFARHRGAASGPTRVAASRRVSARARSGPRARCRPPPSQRHDLESFF